MTPELAELLAASRLAIFVDARLAFPDEDVTVCPIEPSNTAPALGHVAEPRQLLALAKLAYGASPTAWLVTIPVTDLSLGERLTRQAEHNLDRALQRIALLLAGQGGLPVSPRRS